MISLSPVNSILPFSASEVFAYNTVSEYSVEFFPYISSNGFIWVQMLFGGVLIICAILLMGSPSFNKIVFPWLALFLLATMGVISYSLSSMSSVPSEIAPYSTVLHSEIKGIFEEEVGDNIRVEPADTESSGISLTRDHYDPETEEFSSEFVVIDNDATEIFRYQMSVNLDGEVFLERLSD